MHAASFTYVVDPELRGLGYCPAMITAMIAMPELAHVELFGAGVEPDNVASVRCLIKTGFSVEDSDPDWEGFVYYLMRRPTGQRRSR
jgi:RimJ/RimL family protein N-acetyltransferase